MHVTVMHNIKVITYSQNSVSGVVGSPVQFEGSAVVIASVVVIVVLITVSLSDTKKVSTQHSVFQL